MAAVAADGGDGGGYAQVGYSPGFNVGTWEIYQDSEITGDERCRDVHSCALSFPTIKLAFINSQVRLPTSPLHCTPAAPYMP